MFLAHSIRLRDPWQCEASDSGVRWSRLFHRPTGLEPDDSLWLVITGLPLDAAVTVNGHEFPPAADSPAKFDVTPLLTDDNRVELRLPPSALPLPPSAAFPYDARLAIIGRA